MAVGKLGTFYLVYNTAIQDENGKPKYSNIIKLTDFSGEAEQGSSKTYTFDIQEQALLTKNDNIILDTIQEVKGFIPTINDTLDLFYGHTDDPQKWACLYSGIISSKPIVVRDGIYRLTTNGIELFSNSKTIATTLKDGANFTNKTNKEILEQIIQAQTSLVNTKAKTKILFDSSVENTLQTTKAGVRATSNTKIDTLLQDILRANNLSLFVNTKNTNGEPVVQYTITDKYINPNFTKPFFTLNQFLCRASNESNNSPVKQIFRYYYNISANTTLDIDNGTFTKNNLIIEGDAFYNLSGIANVYEDRQLDPSFLTQEEFNLIKTARQNKTINQIIQKTIKDKLNSLALHQVKKEITLNSIFQVSYTHSGLEIQKDWLTAEGKAYFGTQTPIIETGMRFILELEQFGSSQEVIITRYSFDVSNGNLRVVLYVVPVSIFDAIQDNFTLPTLIAKYKQDTGLTPAPQDIIQYIYQNPEDSNAKFQLRLLSPLYFGDVPTSVVNTTPQFIKKNDKF